MKQSIHGFVREAIDNYEKTNPELVDGLDFNMHTILKEVEYMSNNRYTKGDKDENDNYKPFYNITTRLLNNQKVAEDIDRKDMTITTDNPNYEGRVFLLNKFNQTWMRKTKLARVLNDFTETRGKYGGVLLKKTENKDDLFLDIVDWHNVIVDQIDINSGAIVENKYYTPSELIKEAKMRGWDMEETVKAIELYTEENQDDMLREGSTDKKDSISGYVLVREVYGTLPETYLKDEGDEYTYTMQLHVLAGSEIVDGDGREKGTVLYSGEIDESPYKYLPYRKRSVRGTELGIGIVEEARHAQIWTNYGMLSQKNALDYGSKVVMQTASKKYKGKNVLTDFKNGTILDHEEGKPFSGVDLTPQGMSQLGNFMVQWEDQINKALNISDVSTGQDTQSGTPYRLAALLDSNAQSVYNQRREEAEDFWNEVYKDWVIPHLIKQLKKQDHLVATLTPDEMIQIDQDFSDFESSRILVENLLSGKYDQLSPEVRSVVLMEEQNAIKNTVMKKLRRGKNKRDFSYPKDYWDGDIVYELDIQISNEQKQKQAFLETRSNLLVQYLQYRDIIKTDKSARKIFEQLVSGAGLSTVDFDLSPSPADQLPPPQGQPSQTQNNQVVEPAKPQ